MIDISRLGLGCMGMSLTREPERCEQTVRTALDRGITLFNTGNFYGCGESEMLLGKALCGVPRERYFLSLKFGVLFSPDGKIYGLDVDPRHIKAQLTYSLRRLRLDYVDLYQPARMDAAIPVEDIIGEMAELQRQGYIRSIGLTEIDAGTLRRAHKVHPIHTVEIAFSLIDRSAEKGVIAAADELGIGLLTFGALGHGLLSERTLKGQGSSAMKTPLLNAENLPKNLPLVRALNDIALRKDTTLSQLMLAWTLHRLPRSAALVGTTSPAHLDDNIAALAISLTAEDMDEIERISAAHPVFGNDMRQLVFKNGLLS